MHALSCSQSMSMLQVIPGDGKTVKSIMSIRFPSIPADTEGTRLVSLRTVAYVQALGIHSCTYMAPPKQLTRPGCESIELCQQLGSRHYCR